MRSSFRIGAAVLTAAVALALVPTSEAAGVTPTDDGCASAWALLGPGTAEGKEAIMSVIKWRRTWNAEGYERGISQKFGLQVFDRKGGGTVAVAHCGHGATCNELARAVYQHYPNVGSPVVYCVTEPPVILDNPQSF